MVRAGEASSSVVIERDLGTERGPVLAGKLDRYRRLYGYLPARAPLHVGFVVDSGRRAASVRARLRGGGAEGSVVTAWVVAEPRPGQPTRRGGPWTTPEGAEARVVDFAPHWTGDPWPWLEAGRARRPGGTRGPRRPRAPGGPDARERRRVSAAGPRAPRRVPGAPRRTSRDRAATAARRRARHPICSWRARAAEVRHPYGVPEPTPAPGRPRHRARRSDALRAAVPRLAIMDAEGPAAAAR